MKVKRDTDKGSLAVFDLTLLLHLSPAQGLACQVGHGHKCLPKVTKHTGIVQGTEVSTSGHLRATEASAARMQAWETGKSGW